MSLKTPNQIGQANKYLFTDGQKTSWQAIASANVTGANNGTSLNGTNVVLGNDVGGIAGQLTSNREIPLNGFDINYTGSGKLVIPTTSSATTGVIYKGTPGANNRWIHNFGSSNFFAGVNSGNFTLSGAGNTGVGNETGLALTTGISNTNIGNAAGAALTTGSFNTNIGALAGWKTTTGGENVYIGTEAGREGLTNGGNVGIGYGALLFNTAVFNTAIGHRAGFNNTSGTEVIAIGRNSLTSNTTGSNNTSIGSQALSTVITGSDNTAIGQRAGASLTGSGFTGIGQGAGASVTTGDDNTLIGIMSGNVAGFEINTGSGNVLIGANTGIANPATQKSNTVVIGNKATVNSDNTVVLGSVNGINSATVTQAVITGGNTINASAQLQVDSTTKGFLPPRMTSTERNAIATPATGLIVFDTTLDALFVRGASAWKQITAV